MPVSQRKLEANRRNAQKSTGPRDVMQWMLAERIVADTWKQRRLQEAEHWIYENQRTELEREEAEDDPEMASFRKKYPMPGSLVMSIMMRESDELERFQRYEQRLELSICRCRRELRQLQKRDEGKMTPWLGEMTTPVEETEEAICENEPTAANERPRGTGPQPCAHPANQRNEATATVSKRSRDGAYCDPTSVPESSCDEALPGGISSLHSHRTGTCESPSRSSRVY